MPNENGIYIKIKDTVDTKEIQRLMEQANVSILVGFPSGRQHVQTLHRKDRKSKHTDLYGNTPDQITPIDTADLAKMLHFGTADIPARPFLEDGIRNKTGLLRKLVKEQVMKVKDGKKANWNLVGANAVGAVQELVRSDFYKSSIPNSKKTQDYKHSDTPLIDGADMINSLAFIVNGDTEHIHTSKGTFENDKYNEKDFRSKK